MANYEYLVYWRFYQDGNIECEVRASGLMVTTPMENDGDSSPYGTTVDTRTYAPFHQHFIIAKLDLDIDGAENTVVEVDSVAAPMTEDNPYGLALLTQSTAIETESQSARLQLGDTASMEGDQPQQGEPARQQHRLQAGTRGGDPIDVGLRRRSTSEPRSLTTPFG